MFCTTWNYMINVKTNWRTSVVILLIFSLVSKINAWAFVTTPQYTFPVWWCMIWLWLCTSCCLCHIICFGVNMMPMWHYCIFIGFIYAIYFYPDLLFWSFCCDPWVIFNNNISMTAIRIVYFCQICIICNHTRPCILTI